MKTFYYSLLVASLMEISLQAQDNPANKRVKSGLPVSFGLQFKNFALPFKDIKSNFSHPGIFIGTEINLNKRKNLIQQIHVAGYLNDEMGNGFMVYSQLAFNPHLLRLMHPELKLGIGWLKSYHPVHAYEYESGNWERTSGGKSQLILPAGLGIEWEDKTRNPSVVPYLCYQVIVDFFYNDIIPLSFYNSIQIGVKIYLKQE